MVIGVMKVAIIGLGFVGLSFAVVLGQKNFPVLGIDIDQEKILKIKKNIAPFFEPKLNNYLRNAQKKSLQISDNLDLAVRNYDLIFITVSTPSLNSGAIDLKFIKTVIVSIGKILEKTKNKPIPEFLSEGNAIDDTINPHIVVVGGSEKKHIKKMKKFYSMVYKKDIPIIITNHLNAELIKYANNSFLATKISFINQLANICQKLPNANVDIIANAIGLDPRIGNLFLNAGPGFGGSCLPKDLNALINFSSKIGYKNSFLTEVRSTNLKQSKKILELLKLNLGSLKNKKITILGVSFKENSDDIRESVAIKLINLLLQNNVKINAHDPKALPNLKKIFHEKIKYFNSVSKSLATSDCAVILTSWKDCQN